ncbi:MAG: response regulator transcription factor, partial [Pedobacter sp.]
IYDVLVAGAKGYFVKDAKLPHMQEAIEWVIWKDSYFYQFKDSRLSKLLVKSTFPALPVRHNKFTSREVEVLEGIKAQQTTDEISENLFISPKTVVFHRNKLFKKTNSKNAVGLILFALKNKLIRW